MDRVEILYNGGCPLCRVEIARYRALAEAAGAPLAFHDLQGPALAGWPLGAEAAARRLHARLPDGSIVSGVPAFALVWERLPRLRWLARAVRLPGIGRLAGWAYDRVAAPWLYRRHRRRAGLAARGGSA